MHHDGTTRPDPTTPPFDRALLDSLLAEHELDAVIATSPHNVRYLLGGYEFFLYSLADSIGLSRYLPAVAYRRGCPEATTYVGAANENWGTDVAGLWVDDVRHVSWSAEQTADELRSWLRANLQPGARVGLELPYLPADAYLRLSDAGFALADASEPLESLRAVKSSHELAFVRESASAVVDAMLGTFAALRVGDTKADAFERLRQEETQRGLTFCYALVGAGPDFNRGPSSQMLREGDVLSLDSGAMRHGWVADLTRMGIVGEPRARHEELLAQVNAVQHAARNVAISGTRGGDFFATAQAAIAECDDRTNLTFLAHGTGLVTHEAPRLTATGSPPYAAAHEDLPLRAGMVLSVESQVADPELGFIKLEDTVIVGAAAPEPVGDHGRGWNRIGG